MGAIAAAEAGHSRQIIQNSGHSVSTEQGTLLVICDIMSKINHESYSQLTESMNFWRERGGSTLIKEVDFTTSRNASALLASWVEVTNPRGILMMMPTKIWMEAARDTKIPYIQYGGIHDPTKNSGTMVAQSAGQVSTLIFHYLKSKGHSKILYPWKSLASMTHDSVCKAYVQVFGVAAIPVEQAIPLVEFHKPTDWGSYWARALSKVQPTVVILDQTLEAISLISFCGSAGIRIPRDLSVFVNDDGPSLEWLAPRPSHSHFGRDSPAARFKKWVREGMPSKGAIYITPELIDHGTVKVLER